MSPSDATHTDKPLPGDYHHGDPVIVDTTELPHTDADGLPIPVTIPIALAPGIRVVYTTRLGGMSRGGYAACNVGGRSGDDPAAVAQNRMSLSQVVGGPLSIVAQVHSAVAVDADSLFEQNRPYGCDRSGSADERLRVEADGQVTTRCGIALGMFAADCLPVLLADRQSGVIGAAHCGRKGLERGVLPATVELMCAKGAHREHIVATLGPRICGDCYEVGDAIASRFAEHFPNTYTVTRFSGAGIDIAAAALQDLRRAGILREHVIDSRPRVNAATQYLSKDDELEGLCLEDGEGAGLSMRLKALRHGMCTLENPLWYSHRRAVLAHKANEGRLLALIIKDSDTPGTTARQ